MTTSDRNVRSQTLQVAGSIAVAVVIVVITVALVTARLGEGLTGEERRERDDRIEERGDLQEDREEERSERSEDQIDENG